MLINSKQLVRIMIRGPLQSAECYRCRCTCWPSGTRKSFPGRVEFGGIPGGIEFKHQFTGPHVQIAGQGNQEVNR